MKRAQGVPADPTDPLGEIIAQRIGGRQGGTVDLVLAGLLVWLTREALRARRAGALPADFLLFYMAFLGFWLVVNLFESFLYFSSGDWIFILVAGGVATFTDVTYTATEDGQSFALVAADQAGGSGGDLPDANSGDRIADIVATRIAFATLPADDRADNGDVVSGIAFGTQPLLQATDDNGQIDRDMAGSLTLEVSTGSVALIGTNAVAWSGGQVDFASSGLGVTTANDGSVFALGATSGDLTEATTGDLTADIVATQLVFTALPTDAGATNGDVGDQYSWFYKSSSSCSRSRS